MRFPSATARFGVVRSAACANRTKPSLISQSTAATSAKRQPVAKLVANTPRVAFCPCSVNTPCVLKAFRNDGIISCALMDIGFDRFETETSKLIQAAGIFVISCENHLPINCNRVSVARSILSQVSPTITCLASLRSFILKGDPFHTRKRLLCVTMAARVMFDVERVLSTFILRSSLPDGPPALGLSRLLSPASASGVSR